MKRFKKIAWCFSFSWLQEGEPEIAAKMQDLALAEGALPRHLHTAMFTQSNDNRMLTVRYVAKLNSYYNRYNGFSLCDYHRMYFMSLSSTTLFFGWVGAKI